MLRRRFQFSLRSALVTMTLTGVLLAGSLALYRTYFGESHVLTSDESELIEPGMTPLAVRWKIGPPSSVMTISGNTQLWIYKHEDIDSMTQVTFEIDFGADGNVAQAMWSGEGDDSTPQ
jgi:outer membrane protein assembly factor BamE (lipoprotein component of BamABCDE complex)